MKYIKTYEEINQNDYVILIPELLKGYQTLTIPKNVRDFEIFINTNIGKIKSRILSADGYIYDVIYENEPPKNIKSGFMYDFGYKRYYVSTRNKHILKHSSNKEELEAILAGNKYNL